MDNIEFYSVMRSVRAIESADVCLLMIDATRGIESQDVSIFNLIVRNKKGVVILVNKWDLVEKGTNSADEFTKVIKERISPFEDVPIIFTSALTKQRIHKTLETAVEVFERRSKRISTSKLNETLRQAVDQFHPPAVKGKYIKINYVTQLPVHTPAFVFFCNLPQYIRDPYKRYLENRLRETYDFTGVPLQLFSGKNSTKCFACDWSSMPGMLNFYSHEQYIVNLFKVTFPQVEVVTYMFLLFFHWLHADISQKVFKPDNFIFFT
jgi:GTPase